MLSRFLHRWWSRKHDVGSNFDLLRYFGEEAGLRMSISWEKALEISTAFACARVIAEGIAQVPLKLMQLQGGRRSEATEHPLFGVLHRAANSFQTAYEFRETLGFHLVFAGNGYAFKNVVRDAVHELLLLEPGSMTVKRSADNSLQYRYRGQEIPAEAIWHVRGPSWNSWQGLDSVVLARKILGLTVAIEESQASFYKNGAQTSGLLSVEGTLSPTQYAQLRKWLEEEHVGTRNVGRPMILDRSTKFINMAMNAVDAQLIESRKFQVEEICRHFRVMPIMVGYSDKASTYASASEMFLAHQKHTLAPWYQRLEQSIDANLLTEADRAAGLYANFTEEGMLRGSAVETKDVILGYVNGGILTTNEGRALLDKNPDTDPASDRLRVPANITGKAALRSG